MFDYKGKAEDELDLKKGDVVTILKKVWESIYSSFFKVSFCDHYFPTMPSFFFLTDSKSPEGNSFACIVAGLSYVHRAKQLE